MSEEILKALTQLFAIITKQDGGVSVNERDFVINFSRPSSTATALKNTCSFTMISQATAKLGL